MSLSTLSALQKADGGWGYRSGGSWTEPTAYALLALWASRHPTPGVARGIRFLRSLQRSDGAWPPCAGVNHDAWVTALALLALIRLGQTDGLRPAVHWLLASTGRESSWLHRFRLKLRGVPSDYGEHPDGWPWFLGTASWVMPTALTLLALHAARRILPDPRIPARIDAGCRFLAVRMCADGGWNHGASRALGYDSPSYPETTGAALLALHGRKFPRRLESLALARRHLASCRSSQARSWLQLGLRAHAEDPPPPEGSPAPPRDATDIALALLAESARGGRYALHHP